MHGALADAEGQGEGRARPGLTISQKGKHRTVFLLDGPGQNVHGCTMARLERKAMRGRLHIRQGLQQLTQATDLHPQPGAMRFIHPLGLKGSA